MDRTDAKELHAAMQQALRDTLATYGYEPTESRMSYEQDDNGGGSLRVRFAKVDVQGNTLVNQNTQEARAFVSMATDGLLTTWAGEPLNPDALGREVTYNGTTYLFAGYKTRAPKRPYLFRAKSNPAATLVAPVTSALVRELL